MNKQTFNGKEYTLYKGERYFSRGTKYLHRVVWEHYNGVIPKLYQIHHIDGNPHNNDISNLQLLHYQEHASYESKRRWSENYDEMYKKFTLKGQEMAKDWHKSEEGRKWHSEQAKNSYEKREFRTLVCEVCGKEYQTKHTGITKYCHPNCKAKALRLRVKNIQ